VSDRTYYMDDATITLPGGYVDHTTNALEWPIDGDQKVGLIIQRERLLGASADALNRYVAKQTKGYPAQFSGYKLEQADVASAEAGFEMRRLAFRWQKEQEVLYHNQVFVLVRGDVMVMTASAKARYREAVNHLVEHALEGLRVREEADR
jgi:hypothetical protein